MCTVTWVRHPGGYDLFFNRDELRTRKLATPPALHTFDGIQYLSPSDGDFGGTWLGVNQHGLTVGLLNGRGAAPSPTSVSRGEIVRKLMSAVSPADAMDRLSKTPCARYAPFVLLALAADADPLIAQWDGENLRIDPADEASMPVSSSSLDPEGAPASRAKVFGNLVGTDVDAGRLESFHRSHVPVANAMSVCMHRDDAETVSYTRVSVSPETIEMRYEAGSPCLRLEPSVLQLARPSDGPSTKTPRHQDAKGSFFKPN